jgi:hypothetical protein
MKRGIVAIVLAIGTLVLAIGMLALLSLTGLSSPLVGW